MVAILKILTKFGLAIMPTTLLAEYEPTKAWILNEDHGTNPRECQNLIMFLSSVKSEQGHWQEGISQISLYTAKHNFPEHSGTLLVFRTGPLAIQIPIPLSTNEKLKHKATIMSVPSFVNFDSQFGPPQTVVSTDFIVNN